MPDYRTIELLDGTLVLRQRIQELFSILDPDYYQVRSVGEWETFDHREDTHFTSSDVAQIIIQMHRSDEPIPLLSELCLSNLHGISLAAFVIQNMDNLLTDQIYEALTQLKKVADPDRYLLDMVNHIEIRLSWLKKGKGRLDYEEQKREFERLH